MASPDFLEVSVGSLSLSLCAIGWGKKNDIDRFRFVPLGVHNIPTNNKSARE
jgi:hypothetical protein